MLRQRPGVEDTGDSQRTPEGATPLRQREASRVGMQMPSATRQSAARIRLKLEMISRPRRNEPQQIEGRRAFATTDTGSYRADH
jgi:hypothetical protein